MLISTQDEGKFDPRSIPLKSWNDYVCFRYSCVSAAFHVDCLHRRTSSGTGNRIIALARGYLQPKKKMDTNRTRRRYTVVKRIMNQPYRVPIPRLLHMYNKLRYSQLCKIPAVIPQLVPSFINLWLQGQGLAISICRYHVQILRIITSSVQGLTVNLQIWLLKTPSRRFFERPILIQ